MKIGFIGAGNMGGAIIGGIVKNKICDPSEIIAADMNEKLLSNIKERYGINVTRSNEEAAAAQMLFLCVKPGVVYTVIDEIAEYVKPGTIVVSIAAGQPIEKLMAAFGNDDLKLARVMPNTPALVGEGMAAVSPNDNMSTEEAGKVLDIFNSLGKAEIVSERLMDAVAAVSGSSPAYVFMFLEAMADAAVADGMPRAQAYKFAAQSVLGSAKLMLETGKHPGELKDMVCSPAGTTIQAVRVLEEKGLRSAVIEAQTACVKKAKGM